MPQKKGVRKKINGSLHILGYKENDQYIAHCLEFDIVAAGRTHKEASDNFMELVYSYFQFAMEHNIEQFAWQPAPKIYWDVFNKTHKKKAKLPFSIDKLLLQTPKERLNELIEEERTPADIKIHA